MGVGVRMEQLPQFFNLRNVLISETHAPVRACVGAIMHTNVPVYVRAYTCVRIMHVYACVPLSRGRFFHGFWWVIECECQQRHTTKHTHNTIHTRKAHTRGNHGFLPVLECECDERHTKFNRSVFGRTI